MSSVDSDTLAQLERVGGPDFVRSMIEVAVTSMTDQIAELRQAADTGDISGVARTAHALISSSGSVGAAGISTAARAIEARSGAGIVDPTDPDVTRLPTELAAFLEEVGRLRS